VVSSDGSARSLPITIAIVNFGRRGWRPPFHVNECCLWGCGPFGCHKVCAQCRPGEGCRCIETAFGPFCFCEPQVFSPV
jgi:hypothetical protein